MLKKFVFAEFYIFVHFLVPVNEKLAESISIDILLRLLYDDFFLIRIIVESPDHLADPAKEREKERERQDNGTFNGFLCKSSLTMEKETSQSTISVKPFSTPLTLKKQNKLCHQKWYHFGQ